MFECIGCLCKTYFVKTKQKLTDVLITFSTNCRGSLSVAWEHFGTVEVVVVGTLSGFAALLTANGKYEPLQQQSTGSALEELD